MAGKTPAWKNREKVWLVRTPGTVKYDPDK